MSRKPAVADAALEAFCREYVRDFVASRAALRAGLTTSNRSAKQRGYEMMQRPDVQARIAELLRVRAKAADVDADDVLGQYKAIAQADITDVVRWCNEAEVSQDGKTLILKGVVFTAPSNELPPHVRAAIKTVKQATNGSITVEMHDKYPALAKLEVYKQMAGANKRIEVSGPDGSPLTFVLVGMDDDVEEV